MANPWFRMYSEWAHDPKVQSMPEEMQRRLVMLFCEKCSGVTVEERHRSFHWRISDVALSETKVLFIENSFIDEDWNLLNWDKRQFISDSSTDRTRRYRERTRTSQERHGDIGGTKCDGTDTDTDTDTEQKPSSAEPTIDTRPVEFFDAWNRLSGKLPKVETFGGSRRKKVQARLRQGVSQMQFEAAVRICTEKPFLRGENDRGWTATFDWLIDNDRNIEKALNEYNGGGNNGGSNQNRPSPAKERLDRNRRALAEALAKRGVSGPWDATRENPEEMAEPRPRGDGGGISDPLRTTSPEILPPENQSGAR